MPESPGKAVFLSYASQDAEAARRICETLRGAGMEVWFDADGGLEHGDEWDAKIRRQIKECVLFLPLISANTQARHEGYFRIEWELAAERAMGFASGVPFILPIAIDATREPDALVPDRFRKVQWTRLQGGEMPADVLARFLKLWSHRTGVLKAAEMEPGRPRPGERGEGATPATSRPVGRRVPAAAWIAAVMAVIAVVSFIALRPAKPVPETKSPAPTSSDKSAATDKSIAVLPFDNLSTDKENGFFADGVHEDVLTALQNIRELRVLSRTTMMQYRERGQKSLPQIARELGVTYILEGSVRRAGNKVRVSAQLIDARTDAHLWALPAGEHELTNIFAVQAQLASAIANQLQATISPQEKQLMERRPTQNPAAYDLFLKARGEENTLRRIVETLPTREAFLQAAVQLDPKFAEAWAALSRVHIAAYFFNSDHTPARLDRAKVALDTAVRLAPDLPEVIHASGYYYFAGFRDYARALEQWERALRLRPNFPEVLVNLGGLTRRQGRGKEALAYYRKAASLDPGNAAFLFNLARTAEREHHYDEAIVEFRRLAALVPHDLQAAFEPALTAFRATGSTTEGTKFFAGLTEAQSQSSDGLRLRRVWAFRTGNLPEYRRLEQLQADDQPADGQARRSRRTQMAMALAASGDLAAARETVSQTDELRRFVASEPDNTSAWTELARVEALLGNKEEALRCAHKAIELIPETLDTAANATNRQSLAFVYAWTGDKDRALAEYARLLRLHSSVNVHEMRRSPEFFPLQGDPRFEALLNDPKNNEPLF